jgi:hypothetical protein
MASQELQNRIFYYMRLLIDIDGTLIFIVFPEFMYTNSVPKSNDEALDILSRARTAHLAFTLSIDDVIYGQGIM